MERVRAGQAAGMSESCGEDGEQDGEGGRTGVRATGHYRGMGEPNQRDRSRVVVWRAGVRGPLS